MMLDEMRDLLETVEIEPDDNYEYDAAKLVIVRDDDPEMNPRELNENMGTIAAFHQRYDFDESGIVNWPSSQGELEEFLRDEYDAVVLLPLYLLDHSGLRLSTSPFRSAWDSGQLGYIYVTRDDLIRFMSYGEEYDAETLEEILDKGEGDEYDELVNTVKKGLKSEVKVYDGYVAGHVFGYKVISYGECEECGSTLRNVEEECWGYYGIDSIEEIKSEFDVVDGVVE